MSMPEIRPPIRLLVSNKSCGMLIGKQGTGLRRLHTAYKVQVKVEHQPFLETGERLVTLHKRWPGDGLLAVCNVVAKDLKDQPETELIMQMLIPDSAAGAVVGSKGAELRNIFASSGTYVSMQRDPVGPAGERLVGFKGPNAESVALAIDLVAEKAAERAGSKKRRGIEGDNGPSKRAMSGEGPTRLEPQFVNMRHNLDVQHQRDYQEFSACNPSDVPRDAFHQGEPQHTDNRNFDSFDYGGPQHTDNRNFDSFDYGGPQHTDNRNFDSFYHGGPQHTDNRNFDSFYHGGPQHTDNQNLPFPPQRDIIPMQMAPPFEPPHMRHDPRFAQPFEAPLYQPQGPPLMEMRGPRRNGQGGEDGLLRLLVNHDSAGEIVGKKGSGFKRFREQFGANVKVINDPAFSALGRSIEISGEPSSQDAAARAILDIACMTVDGKSMARLLFPSSKAGLLIGKGGAALTAVRTSTGAYVKVDREEMFGERVATVSGPDAAAVGAAVCILAAVLRRAKDATRPGGGRK